MNALTIKTRFNMWVIPHNCELLKALISLQGLGADDLVFSSSSDCQQFIHELALLATRDELDAGKPSPLTPIIRQLIAHQSKSGAIQNNLFV